MTAITINAKNRTIELTKSFATASSKFGTDEYAELQIVRKDYPNYKVVTITRKATKSDKPTFKGLTYEYMVKYIKSHDNAEENMAEYMELRGICLTALPRRMHSADNASSEKTRSATFGAKDLLSKQMIWSPILDSNVCEFLRL